MPRSIDDKKRTIEVRVFEWQIAFAIRTKTVGFIVGVLIYWGAYMD